LGLTSGALCVLYSPQTSLNGAKLLLNKGPAKRPTVEDMSDAVAAPAIIIPGVTRDGEFTSGLPNKRKRDKERQDPRKSHRPELPVHGPGRGGRVGASATQHVVQNLVRDTTRDEDVRVPLFSFSFCVSLRYCGMVVVSETVWLNRADDCPGDIQAPPVQRVFVHSSGEGEKRMAWQ
jgi:WD repeat-containing protein 70